MISSGRLIPLLFALVPALALGGALWLMTAMEEERRADEEQQQAREAELAPHVSLIEAMERDLATFSLRSDGWSVLEVTAQNPATAPLNVILPRGQVYLEDRERGEVLQPDEMRLTVPAQGERTVKVPVLPSSILNQGSQPWRSYRASRERRERAELLLDYLVAYPDAAQQLLTGPEGQPDETLRTAILLCTENVPFFALSDLDLAVEPPLDLETDASRVSLAVLIKAAWVALDAGVPRAQLALLQDPQFQLAAMLDPLTHPAALKLFDLDEGIQRSFWQDNLRRGPVNLRHYSFHGLARYYPETAMEMLPQWVRYEELSLPLRREALLALGAVDRPEAAPLIRRLRYEQPESSPLRLAARNALDMHQRSQRWKERVASSRLRLPEPRAGLLDEEAEEERRQREIARAEQARIEAAAERGVFAFSREELFLLSARQIAQPAPELFDKQPFLRLSARSQFLPRSPLPTGSSTPAVNPGDDDDADDEPLFEGGYSFRLMTGLSLDLTIGREYQGLLRGQPFYRFANYFPWPRIYQWTLREEAMPKPAPDPGDDAEATTDAESVFGWDWPQ